MKPTVLMTFLAGFPLGGCLGAKTVIRPAQVGPIATLVQQTFMNGTTNQPDKVSYRWRLQNASSAELSFAGKSVSLDGGGNPILATVTLRKGHVGEDVVADITLSTNKSIASANATVHAIVQKNYGQLLACEGSVRVTPGTATVLAAGRAPFPDLTITARAQ
jgi:hypothetical protein